MTKRMITKTFCDAQDCKYEARHICRFCGNDVCGYHLVQDDRLKTLADNAIRFEPLCLGCLTSALNLLPTDEARDEL